MGVGCGRLRGELAHCTSVVLESIPASADSRKSRQLELHDRGTASRFRGRPSPEAVSMRSGNRLRNSST